MIRPMMTGLVSLSLLLVATSTATAQQAQENDTQRNRSTQIGQQQNAQQNQRAELPDSLKQLDLSEQQKQGILAIYRESDRKAQQVWNRVQDLHRQAIRMEAAVIAAARLEGHDHGAHASQSAQRATDDQNKQAASSQSDQASEEVAAADENANNTRTTLKPTSDADDRSENRNQKQNDSNDQAKNQRDQRSENRSGRSSNDQASSWKGIEGDLNIVAIRVGVAQPDGRVREYFLTQPVSQDENSEACQACQAHQNQLMQVWKDIHEGHEQLVELEADTIVQVESHLTEQQLQKLDQASSQAASTQQGRDHNQNRSENSRQ